MQPNLRVMSPSRFLAISIGLVYFFFGILKFFPELSPAEELAKNTIHQLSFGLIPEQWAIIALAVLESVIGLMLLLNQRLRLAIYLALGHMVCTFTPLFFFPELAFTEAPYFPSLLGQYIGKNIIIVAALISLRTQPVNREKISA